MAAFSTPRGTQDILPSDWPLWSLITSQAEIVAALFGYRRIGTPTFGDADLFARTTGEGTDIVEKEMYTFHDRSGDWLALRPEGTAPVVRAYLEHGMSRWPQPVKLYYIEPMFRYERPQRGRFREHHQFGCEALGLEDAYVDVEMIALLVELYRRLGLSDLDLHINSIGDQRCRPDYILDLVAYLRRHETELAPRDLERLERNPLRVLDTKEPASLAVVESAPSILDYLCNECRVHWDRLQHGLQVLEIEYTVNPHLVRGLDYYTRTVFEFYAPEAGAQVAVSSGGRYDALAEQLGGHPTPGIGFGLGIERVIMLLTARGAEIPESGDPRVYLAHTGREAEDAALREAALLRQRDIPAVMSFGERSLKAQMKQANNAHAAYAGIIGEDELATGTIALRDLASGEQRSVPADEVPGEVSAEGRAP